MMKLVFFAALVALALAAPEAKPDAQVGLIHPTGYTGYPYGVNPYSTAYGVSPYSTAYGVSPYSTAYGVSPYTTPYGISPYMKGYYGAHLGQWGGLYGNGLYGNNYLKSVDHVYPGHLGYHGYPHHGYPYHGIY